MSDGQKAIWVPKAERLEIFGSYAQTELGHGSNVRDIETTATFDAATDEFVINSPTLSSTKYWIGATGIWATHSLVVARLIIAGKEYGNHLFMVQLRDLETHELLPGVEIYELGPKAFQGMVGVDNGAMQFHNVRIPRDQMLARHAQVLRDGTYISPKNTKHSYGSMVTVRAIMAEATGYDLLKAVAVAYHYTTFRKQFWRNGEADETTVFNYASVKYRLLPLLARASSPPDPLSCYQVSKLTFSRALHWFWLARTSNRPSTTTARRASKRVILCNLRIFTFRPWALRFIPPKLPQLALKHAGLLVAVMATARCRGLAVCMPILSMQLLMKATTMSSHSKYRVQY